MIFFWLAAAALGALVMTFAGFSPSQFMVTRRDFKFPVPPLRVMVSLSGTAHRLRSCWVDGLKITSGWRPPELNAMIPRAVSNSRHVAGRAVDVAGPAASLSACVVRARNAGFTEVLHYPERGYAHLGWGRPYTPELDDA